MNRSLFHDRDFRLVAGGLSALGDWVAIVALGLHVKATQGLALALPALWLSFAFFLACSLLGGLAHGLKNVMFRSLIHVRVPGHLHGRAFAAYNGIRNSAELGALPRVACWSPAARSPTRAGFPPSPARSAYSPCCAWRPTTRRDWP